MFLCSAGTFVGAMMAPQTRARKLSGGHTVRTNQVWMNGTGTGGETKAGRFHTLLWINPHQDRSLQLVVASPGNFFFSGSQAHFQRAKNVFFVSGSSYHSVSHGWVKLTLGCYFGFGIWHTLLWFCCALVAMWYSEVSAILVCPNFFFHEN